MEPKTKKVTALDYLSKIDLQARLLRYSNAPLHAVTSRKFNDRTTNGLTIAVLRWLQLHQNYAVRVSTTGRRIPDRNVIDVIGRNQTIRGQWIKGTTKRGTSDIHSIINGKHCSIEIKCEQTRDRMSEAQQQTMKDVQQSGGEYFICRNFEEFLLWYTNIKKS